MIAAIFSIFWRCAAFDVFIDAARAAASAIIFHCVASNQNYNLFAMCRQKKCYLVIVVARGVRSGALFIEFDPNRLLVRKSS